MTIKFEEISGRGDAYSWAWDRMEEGQRPSDVIAKVAGTYPDLEADAVEAAEHLKEEQG